MEKGKAHVRNACTYTVIDIMTKGIESLKNGVMAYTGIEQANYPFTPTSSLMNSLSLYTHGLKKMDELEFALHACTVMLKVTNQTKLPDGKPAYNPSYVNDALIEFMCVIQVLGNNIIDKQIDEQWIMGNLVKACVIAVREETNPGEVQFILNTLVNIFMTIKEKFVPIADFQLDSIDDKKYTDLRQFAMEYNAQPFTLF